MRVRLCGGEKEGSRGRNPQLPSTAEDPAMQNATEITIPAGVIKSPWTDETIKVLRRLLSDGCKTAAQVASSLASEINLPITKNMVIGKCYRTGIALNNARSSWRPAEPTPNPFPEPGHCIWGIGHPGAPGFHFCGEPNARVYCEAHRALAYDRRAPAEGGANA